MSASFIDSVQTASQLLVDGKLNEARQAIEPLGPTPPADTPDLDKAKFYEVSGDLALAQGNLEGALDAFEFMIRYEERGGETASGLGNSHGKVGEALAALDRHDEAITAFRTGVKMMEDANSREAFIATLNFQLAESLFATSQYHEAIHEYGKTISLAEHEPEPRSLGFLNYRMACSFEPLALFQQTIKQVRTLVEELKEMDVRNAELEGLLEGYQDPGFDYAEAATGYYRKALEHLADADDDALEVRVWRDLGKLQRSVNELENAINALESARSVLERGPQPDRLTTGVFLELGEARLLNGDLNAALTTLDRALETATGADITRALAPRSHALALLGRTDEARLGAADALGSMTENGIDDFASVLATLVETFEATGDHDTAQALQLQIDAMEN